MECNVKNVAPLPDHRILIDFENGERKIFDVTPYICGSWFGKLSDPDYFRTVRPCGDTVVWADGQDLAPHEIYELSESICIDN